MDIRCNKRYHFYQVFSKIISVDNEWHFTLISIYTQGQLRVNLNNKPRKSSSTWFLVQVGEKFRKDSVIQVVVGL